MTQESEARRLADRNGELIQKLRRTPMPLADLIPHLNEMGDELRRLEEANAELLEALKQSERALSAVAKDDPTFQLARHGLRCARAAIAKHGGPA